MTEILHGDKEILDKDAKYKHSVALKEISKSGFTLLSDIFGRKLNAVNFADIQTNMEYIGLPLLV